MDIEFLRRLQPFLKQKGYSLEELAPGKFSVQCSSKSPRSEQEVYGIYILVDRISQIPSTEDIEVNKQWPDIYGFCIETRLHNTQIARQLFILELQIDVSAKITIQDELRVRGFKRTDVEIYNSAAEQYLRFYKLCKMHWSRLRELGATEEFSSAKGIIVDYMEYEFKVKLAKQKLRYSVISPTKLAKGWKLNASTNLLAYTEHIGQLNKLGFSWHQPSNRILKALCKIAADHPEIRADIEELDNVVSDLSDTFSKVLNSCSSTGKRYKQEIWQDFTRHEVLQNKHLVKKPYFNSP
ncbi:hypothetical protein PGN35_020430 [Nodosilinea sp. PGN35]|uniref:hypothetical protein n=1 Tax=Nodosilinea sp. PGN35 TaxID=3020489 RepID=UPI00398ABC6D